MSRRPLKLLLATVVATATTGAISAASAAPITGVVHSTNLQASVSHPLVQKAYWVWRHHHRYWVRPHHG